MDSARADFGADGAATDFGLDGDAGADGLTRYGPADSTVAVLDTGIDAGHVDLDESKVLAFHDFVSQPAASCAPAPPPGTAYDDQGHGTHVASIIAGDGDGNSAYRGVAPGAALVGL
jgi:serine protease AprX